MRFRSPLIIAQLHPRLRTAYCKFLLRAYVDCEPRLADLDTVDFNFVR